jgi:hypothetical protein
VFYAGLFYLLSVDAGLIKAYNPKSMEDRKMNTRTFTGQFGIVLLVDTLIEERARKINDDNRLDNLIDLEKSRPHISLYHGPVKDLPLEEVHHLMFYISDMLPIPISLTKLSQFGGKFLFWDVENLSKLRPAHFIALHMAKYYDEQQESASVKEQLDLTPNQQRNLLKLGHPLVGTDYRPHITVGYFHHPLRNDEPLTLEAIRGQAQTVAFVQIGENGVIDRILYEQ